MIRLESVTKDYQMGPTVVHALRGVDLEVEGGELIAIMGSSGSGKSTLLNIIGCLDRPTGGRYTLEGTVVSGLSREQLATVRNRKIGFVFQTFNLLPRASALDNVMLPLSYAGLTGSKARERARMALDMVGLADRAEHKPAQLSGGQQQRVAIARSLVTGPQIILADEPTGNLDTRSSYEIMAIMQSLNDLGITIVVVTHEADISTFCRRILAIQDGKIVGDTANSGVRRAIEMLPTAPVAPQEGVAS